MCSGFTVSWMLTCCSLRAGAAASLHNITQNPSSGCGSRDVNYHLWGWWAVSLDFVFVSHLLLTIYGGFLMVYETTIFWMLNFHCAKCFICIDQQSCEVKYLQKTESWKG